MKNLFETAQLGKLTLKNRLIRSATWEGIALSDGGITGEAYKIYEELALGGFYRNGRLTEPDEMTVDEIQSVVQMFTDAARRAKEAGFDGVQIHAAHFFFLSRFISPAVNHRTDAYGGSTENRMRILLDILSGIRTAAPGLHVTVKINCSDFTYHGLGEAESLAICKALAAAGIGSIEVSGNGKSLQGIRAGVNEGYFVLAPLLFYISTNDKLASARVCKECFGYKVVQAGFVVGFAVAGDAIKLQNIVAVDKN